MAALDLLAALPFLFALVAILDRRRAWPAQYRLPERPGAPADASVVAIVPARDEASVLPHTLPALLSQEIGGLRVIVVDDESSDGTAEVARRVAAEAGFAERLEVYGVPPRPPDWSGKVHALAVGVARANLRFRPEWFLFTDADIRHRPGSLAALLAVARSGPYDLVSVMARLRAENFWERLSIPPFVYFFQRLYPFRSVVDPDSRVAAAAGGCILVRREALERAGGLAAIRHALIDDVALARVVKRSGGRLWLGLDPGIESIRAYRALRDVWRMVARSAFDQLGYRYELAALVVVGLFVFLASPPALAAWALVGPSGPRVRPALLALGAWAIQALSLLPAVRHHRVPWPFAATLPFASALYALMTASSAWEHFRGRGGLWKGRTGPERPSRAP
jgi:hopene-associated glycosyltransferase HpnB